MSMKGRDILIALAVKCDGDWDRIMDMIHARKVMPEEEINAITAKGLQAITIIDDDYPRYLRNSYKPPICLFYKGDKSLIKNGENLIAYVGSRDATPYALEMAEKICSGISEKGYTVVSGMARGVDWAALRAAIKGKGRAIAFLGSGIDKPYPECNRDLYNELCTSGLLLSEYPFDVEPKPSNFPFRNRMIAASCRALIVGGAKPRSATSATVNYAVGTHCDVGAIPFEAGTEFMNNQLIKDGATLIENVEDAVSLLLPPAKEAKTI